MVDRMFVDLPEVAEALGCTLSEAGALVTSGELSAMYLRECGEWRVRIYDLEVFRSRGMRLVS